MERRAATAWGDAAVVDEVSVPQRAGAKRFAAVIQLLAGSSGEALVRFAYTTDGTTRHGPVTLRARDLERLGRALARHPELAAALAGLGGGDASEKE